MDTDSRRRRRDPSRLPSPAIAGQATFAGCLAVIDIAREALLPMLPPSVRLPESESPKYPCLLVFGEQRNGTTFFGGMAVPWGLRYHELMVAVPFVRWDAVPGEHLFVSGMTCDFWPAVWNGNFYYGFRKRLAQMSWDGDRFSAAGEGRHPGFRATARGRGQATDDALDWIRSAAALPVLGHRDDGVFVQSRFDWDFREAEVDPVTLAFTLGRHFRELPPGESTACRQDDAYRVRRMQWRLSWPTVAPSR
jgi:hypothetical protein